MMVHLSPQVKEKNMAQIHRFHDKVAIHIGDSSTIYLTPKVALAIANAMIECVDDIDLKFTESLFGTVEIEEE